jgi:hypothetical protein
LFVGALTAALGLAFFENFDTIRDFVIGLFHGEKLLETLVIISAISALLTIASNDDLAEVLLHFVRLTLKRSSLLREGSVNRHISDIDDRYIKSLIRNELKGVSQEKLDVPPEETSAIVSRVEEKLTDELRADLERSIGEKLGFQGVQSLYERALSRLNEQVAVLGSRANTSLIIGILFSVAGLFVLYFTFFSSLRATAASDSETVANLNYLGLMRDYLPRLSLVIIIEVVGFFFLRLYSKALNELRYAQNETTNVEMRMIALLSSISQGYEDCTVEVIRTISLTERNNIIEKNQSTIEIEKERAGNEGDLTTINAISALLHGTEKGWFWKKRE